MKFAHLSTASALALVLALGAPGHAQVTDEPVDEPAAAVEQPAPGATVAPADEAADDPAVTSQVGPDQLALNELDEKLEEMGIEDRETFEGEVIVARTSEGEPFVMLMGPEGFERGATTEFELEDFEELREQLTEAGFEHIRQEHALPVIQGTLDDYSVFAASGEPEWGGDPADLGATADLDRDRFEEKLGDAGIEDRSEFEGKLVYGTTREGERITMLIGPEGFAGEEEIDLSEGDLRDRFEGAGVTDVSVIDENIYMFRGSYADMSVLAFGGQALGDRPVATGTVQPTPQPEIDADVPDPDEVEVEQAPEAVD